MGRIVKSPNARQNEILDVAQQLFFTKGYENTAVQDIINEIGIAKGTFYYHFNSKGDLLDALIVRLLDKSLLILEPILADERLTALEKLHLFFGEVGKLKMENEMLIRTLLPIWYGDSNTMMREKTKLHSLNWFSPLYNQIIRQGIEEGVFTAQYSDEIGNIVLQTMTAMSDALARLLINTEDKPPWANMQNKIDAYNSALDRLLGAAPGSIQLFEFEPFYHWFKKED